VFTAGDDGLVKAMTINCEEEHIFKGHRNYVQSLAIDPTNSLLLSGSLDKSAILWDLRIGTDIWIFHNIHKEAVNSVSFSHDSTCFITSSFDGAVNLWDTISQNSIKMLSPGVQIPVCTSKFTHNSKYIWANCLNNSILLWDCLGRKTPIIKTYGNHVNNSYKVDSL
jgi:WD40 repeat protein